MHLPPMSVWMPVSRRFSVSEGAWLSPNCGEGISASPLARRADRPRAIVPLRADQFRRHVHRSPSRLAIGSSPRRSLRVRPAISPNIRGYPSKPRRRARVCGGGLPSRISIPRVARRRVAVLPPRATRRRCRSRVDTAGAEDARVLARAASRGQRPSDLAPAEDDAPSTISPRHCTLLGLLPRRPAFSRGSLAGRTTHARGGVGRMLASTDGGVRIEPQVRL